MDTNGSNAVINDFSDMVYGILYQHTSATTIAECCRKESGFNDCVSCTKEALGLNNLGGDLVEILVPQLTQAIIASYIGAGLNARC